MYCKIYLHLEAILVGVKGATIGQALGSQPHDNVGVPEVADVTQVQVVLDVDASGQRGPLGMVQPHCVNQARLGAGYATLVVHLLKRNFPNSDLCKKVPKLSYLQFCVDCATYDKDLDHVLN